MHKPPFQPSTPFHQKAHFLIANWIGSSFHASRCTHAPDRGIMTLMSSRRASLLSSLPPFFLLSDFYINYCPFCLACTPPRNTNFPSHLYSARLSSHFLSFLSSFISPSTSIPFSQDAPALFTCLPLHSDPSCHLFIHSFCIYPPSFLEFNSTDCCQKGEFCQTGWVKMLTEWVGTQSQILHHPLRDALTPPAIA